MHLMQQLTMQGAVLQCGWQGRVLWIKADAEQGSAPGATEQADFWNNLAGRGLEQNIQRRWRHPCGNRGVSGFSLLHNVRTPGSQRSVGFQPVQCPVIHLYAF